METSGRNNKRAGLYQVAGKSALYSRNESFGGWFNKRGGSETYQAGFNSSSFENTSIAQPTFSLAEKRRVNQVETIGSERNFILLDALDGFHCIPPILPMHRIGTNVEISGRMGEA